MTLHTATPALPFTRLDNCRGFGFELNDNASVRRIYCDPVVLNLFTGTELDGGLCQFYLRRHQAGQIDATVALLGPASPLAFGHTSSGWCGQGHWQGVAIELQLQLAATDTAWFWHIRLENTRSDAVTLDIIHTQDVGLAHYGTLRLNEYYVSQYVDCTPLRHERHGQVLAFRQNQPMAGQHPWLLLASLGEACGYVSDALQFHGLASRAGDPPHLLSEPVFPCQRLQHEHTLAVLAETPVTLPAATAVQRGFQALYRPHHPAASSAADLVELARLNALAEACPPARPGPTGQPAIITRFNPARLLACTDLPEAELHQWFGGDWQAVEREGDQLLSFFTGTQTHVVLQAKERQVLRPHGHILRTGTALTPDEAALTTTVWMSGIFNALLTQGHVSINRFLSTSRSYLSLFRSHGQRVFVECADGYRLLDLPSAFAMNPNGCRWFYRWAEGLIVVSTEADWNTHRLELRLEVREGAPRRFLLSQSIGLYGDDGAWPVTVPFRQDADGIVFPVLPDTEPGQRFPTGYFRLDVDPPGLIERVSGDAALFADGGSRQQPWVVVEVAATRQVVCRISGHLVAGQPEPDPRWPEARAFWQATTARLSGPDDPAVIRRLATLQAIQPWYAHNALIHFLAPRGLEQFSGGGWGVRDVSQGPVELLLALGLSVPVRDLLLRVFAAQNDDGDWPQWFMFFERERHIRPGDSHGDIVFWPVLALARYLLASGDASVLAESVSYYHPDGVASAQQAPVRDHVERAFAVMAARRIRGTRLAAYGHGDWNDSLQPVDPTLRENLCSSWTVTLHYQTLTMLAAAWRAVGYATEAERLDGEADAIRTDFRRYLLVDGVLAGFAWFQGDDTPDYLVHPRDTRTGLRYSALPMIHAILTDLLTDGEARAHLALIDQHLKGPDGVRLFDQPPPYRGGPQHYFQRAESAAFFGREIGLMYTHAHLRYAEALAHVGEAAAFFEALCLVVPIDLRTQISQAGLRQANCYHSSSDAAFADRYEASAHYDRIHSGQVSLEGGWRIYSSGAGIACRLIRECWLGLREEWERTMIDPVMPPTLAGLRADLIWKGAPLTLLYRIGDQGSGPLTMEWNGVGLAFERQSNPYRIGGGWVANHVLRAHWQDQGNCLQITLG